MGEDIKKIHAALQERFDKGLGLPEGYLHPVHHPDEDEIHFDEIVKHGVVVSHFKRVLFTEEALGKNPYAGLLIVWGRARNWETQENLIVYQAAWDHRMWVRPQEMFTSRVDLLKYPKYQGQYWRFELYNGPLEPKFTQIPVPEIGRNLWVHINSTTQDDVDKDPGRWVFEVLADVIHSETNQKMYLVRGCSRIRDNIVWAIPEKEFTDRLPPDREYHDGVLHFTHALEVYCGVGGTHMSPDNMFGVNDWEKLRETPRELYGDLQT